MRLDALLAEYSALRAEILARSGFQHQIVQLHVSAVTIIAGALVTGHGRLAAVSLPIESCLFGLWYLDHALTIKELSAYIRLWTQGMVDAETMSHGIMRWESSYTRGVARRARFRIHLFYAVVAATFILPAILGFVFGATAQDGVAGSSAAAIASEARSITTALVWVGYGLMSLFVAVLGYFIFAPPSAETGGEGSSARHLTNGT